MKLSLRRPITRFAILVLGGAMLEVSFASCADTETATDQPAPKQTFGPDAADATTDGDASDACVGDACRPPIPSCDEVEWCAVDTALDSRVALSAVWGSGKNDVWAVGSAGHVLHWDGTVWAAAPVPAGQSLYAIGGSGPNDVWTVSTGSAIFHSKGFVGGAAQWSLQPAIPHQPPNPRGPNGGGQQGPILKAIWSRTTTDVWVGGEALVGAQFDYETAWQVSPAAAGGLGWNPMYALDNKDTNAIWGSGPNDVWLAGTTSVSHTDGTLSDAGVPGLAWKAFDVPSVAPLYALWGSGPGDVWAVGGSGVIVHFTSAVGQWRAVTSPTTENLRALWGSSATDVWAVGDHGTLLHFDGKTWLASTGAFAPTNKPDLLGVWGSGPSDIWAVGSETILHFTGPK